MGCLRPSPLLCRRSDVSTAAVVLPTGRCAAYCGLLPSPKSFPQHEMDAEDPCAALPWRLELHSTCIGYELRFLGSCWLALRFAGEEKAGRMVETIQFRPLFSSDCSVAIAGIVIFFAVFYTGAAKNLKWWGTEVYQVCAPDTKPRSLSPRITERTTANDTCLPYRTRAIGRAVAICSALQNRV